MFMASPRAFQIIYSELTDEQIELYEDTRKDAFDKGTMIHKLLEKFGQ